MKYALSACLLGIPCRWNGESRLNKEALEIYLKGDAIAVCPELGLPTPRPASEISYGKVVDKNKNDYSNQFISGASRELEMIKQLGIKEAILRKGSPSCGVNYIYDGTFTGKLINGSGVFAELLKKEGIKLTEVE